jgi:hypothetical protein
MRLAGVATMLTMALMMTAIPTQAQENRATERAVTQAQDTMQEVDQALRSSERSET